MTPQERLVPSSVVSRQTAELRAAVTAQEATRTPARNPVTWFARLVVEVINKADRDRLLGLAAETAFFAVLTLFPILLVVAAVVGQLGAIIGAGNAERVEQAVLDFLDRVLTDSASGAVNTVRSLFDTGGDVLTFATVLALASLATAFSTLVNTVNIVYDVPETRGWWRRRWLGLALGLGSVLTGALALTLLVIGPLYGAQGVLDKLGIGMQYDFLWSFLRWPVAFGSLMLWAATMGHLMPAQRTRWRYELPGAVLTTLLWLAASYGLSLYVDVVVSASSLIGALGGGLILMTWAYLLCVSLLGGSELNAILQARRRHREAQAAERLALEQQAVPEQMTQDATSVQVAPEREPDPATAR